MSGPIQKHPAFSRIITKDKELLSIFDYAASVAHSPQPVLITGETGVGKDLIAKCIYTLSGVKGKRVIVNVAGLDDNLFADTLFGHVKGAFSGAEQKRCGLIERANGGILIMDEIGDLSLISQLKLLRLLEDGDYLPLGSDQHKHSNVRMIFTTNRDLWKLQRKGRFRKDLNFRLRTHHINLPPLRRRSGDIPLLVDHFLKEAAQQSKCRKPRVSEKALALLKSHAFPGNVRELRAIVLDAAMRGNSGPLMPVHFKFHIEANRIDRQDAQHQTDPDLIELLACMPNFPTLYQMDRLLMAAAMQRANGKQSAAARLLGISQPALCKRLKKGNLYSDSMNAARKIDRN